MRNLLLLTILVVTSACTTTQANKDPYEASNRKIFEFNQKFDRAIMDPLANGYNKVMPTPAKKGVNNALANLREPMTFANDLLQLKPKRAGKTLTRFVVNSTIGLGGLWNPAEKMGIKRHTEDLGQTLAVWGIDNAPYYVIPFVGPSTTRDTFGFMVTLAVEPMDLFIEKKLGLEWVYLRLGADVLTIRSDLDKVLDDLYEQKDPYILARSAYLQARGNAIRDGKTDPALLEEDDDMFFEDDLNDQETAVYQKILDDINQKKSAKKGR